MKHRATCPLSGPTDRSCTPTCAWLLTVEQPAEHAGMHACALAALASHRVSERHDVANMSAVFFNFKEEKDA